MTPLECFCFEILKKNYKKRKIMFSFQHTKLWLWWQSSLVVLLLSFRSCFFLLFLDPFLSESIGGTTNFDSVLGGYLSPYVVGGGIDCLPPTALMKPLLGECSGDSSLADNFELSYLVAVQTRVNAQVCFRCLSLREFISSFFFFFFQGWSVIDVTFFFPWLLFQSKKSPE